MTLYRELTDKERQDVMNGTPGAPRKMRRRFVVPVERCKHKRLDSHLWCSVHKADHHRFTSANCSVEWCRGAGIGDTDE